MIKAVFLDRDGVLNKPVLNPKTGEFESPHSESDLELFDWAVNALKDISAGGYALFLVSNQPSAAKGKAPLSALKAVHNKFHALMTENAIKFEKYYYCYHHPRGAVKELTTECECRKPKPFFVNEAINNFGLKREFCWFVGDRDADVNCGKTAGVRTILVKEPLSASNQGKSHPDFTASDLKVSAEIILREGIK